LSITTLTIASQYHIATCRKPVKKVSHSPTRVIYLLPR